MTSTTTQTTFLQRTLGRNYKWWYIIWYSFKAQRAYRGDTIMFAISTLIGLGAPILVWYISVLHGSDIDIKTLFTYILVGTLYNALCSYIWVTQQFGWEVNGGNFTPRLLVPTDTFWRIYAELIGRAMLGNFIINAIPIITLGLIFHQYLLLPSSWLNFLLFLFFIPVSYTIMFCFEWIMGCLVFWFTEIAGVNDFAGNIVNFFKGGFIPLYLLSDYFQPILFQPFAWLLHHPMQIYLGKYDYVMINMTLLGGIAWCIILYFLAKLVFKLGLKRNESVGL